MWEDHYWRMAMKRLHWVIIFISSFIVFNLAHAGIYWLPDYLKDNIDTNHRTETDTGGGDGYFNCEENGYSSSPCTAPQIEVQAHNMVTHICYECKCPTNYTVASCDDGWHVSGTPCKIGTTNYYTGCAVDTCPAGYTAGKTCGSGYDREVNGKSGSQDCAKCVAKTCPSGFTAGLANCDGKTYPAGWTYSSNGYSGDSVCGKCTAKTCSSGTAGLANCNGKAQPSGWTYSSNGYAGDSVCGTCTAKSCPASYTAGTTGCSNTSSWTYGSNGYSGDSICGKCTPKDCANGYTAGLADCNGKAHPAGWTYGSGTPSGNTVCGKCTAKTCAAGSTSCDVATQNATANGYYAGDSVCYTCSAKTCEQMNKKTCGSSCIATSACCTNGSSGCPAGEECQNGTCVRAQLSCIEQYMKDNPSAKFAHDSFDDGDNIVIYSDSSEFDIGLLNGRRDINVFNGVCGNTQRLSGTLIDASNITFYDSGVLLNVEVQKSDSIYFNGISNADIVRIKDSMVNLDFASGNHTFDVLNIGPRASVTLGSDYNPHVAFGEISFQEAFESSLSLMTPMTVWFNEIIALGWVNNWQAEYNPSPASIYINSYSSFQGDRITLGIYSMEGGGDLVFDNEGSLYITHVAFSTTRGNNYHAHVNQLQVNNSGNFVTMYDDASVGDADITCEGNGKFIYTNNGGWGNIFYKENPGQCTMDCSRLVGSVTFNEENVDRYCN